MDSELLDFQRIQQGFAKHIKNPNVSPMPGDVDDRHMTIYRDLFFKNVMGFLTGAFPVLAEILGDGRWQEIGRDFFSRHHNKTPYFLEISREFLAFLDKEFYPEAGDPAYIYELAHYEWLELFVDVEPESAVAPFQREGDVVTGVSVLSPVVEGFLYQYPVHEISIANASCEPKATALIVYRRRDDSVGFVVTNPFTLQLLAQVKEKQDSGEQVVNSLLEEMGMADNLAAFEGGIDTLKQWLELGIIWGIKAESLTN
jgi:hypothetical protein